MKTIKVFFLVLILLVAGSLKAQGASAQDTVKPELIYKGLEVKEMTDFVSRVEGMNPQPENSRYVVCVTEGMSMFMDRETKKLIVVYPAPLYFYEKRMQNQYRDVYVKFYRYFSLNFLDKKWWENKKSFKEECMSLAKKYGLNVYFVNAVATYETAQELSKRVAPEGSLSTGGYPVATITRPPAGGDDVELEKAIPLFEVKEPLQFHTMLFDRVMEWIEKEELLFRQKGGKQ
ncbi:MAG: hypothetical protein QXQ64_03905 [Candidatus Bathyarchaeia archaeon]